MDVRTSYTFIFSIFISAICRGQMSPVYSFQQDDSLAKRKYFEEAIAKKKALLNAVTKENAKDYKEAYNNMFDVVEDLLLSQRSVTEKGADSYIKSIVSKIVSANSELQGLDMRVVFSRDMAPNAYSIGDGTIAINAGLFIYLNNEAELAFVICHELAHYYLSHSKKNLDRYVEVLNSDSLKKEIKRLVKQEYRVGEQLQKLYKNFVFDVRRHSRDREEEADKEGLRLFKNTGYNGNAFITSMQVLDKIDDTTMFNRLNLQKILSPATYPFKDRWIKKESAIFGSMNAEEATGLTKKEKELLKTHPDCSKRIALLSDAATKITGSDFLVNQKLFYQLKEDFIPEIVEEVFKSGNISFNLYLSLKMLQEGKHVPLAVYSIARDLNLIYKHQKEHQLGLITDSENNTFEEEYNLLLRMLYRIKLNEIAELNAGFCSQYDGEMKNYIGFAEEMQKANENKLAHQ